MRVEVEVEVEVGNLANNLILSMTKSLTHHHISDRGV